MTSAIGRARKKFFAQDPDVQQYAAKDTINEGYVAATDQSEVGRTDRRKRDVPLGLSESDSAILGTVKRHANVLDKSFNLCGVKFGWTFIIAIVPVVGDALNLALGYFLVVRQARKSKIPYSLTRRMMLNLAISASIGLVPGIGDILLAAYRANLRNARLLEKFLLLRGERAAASTVQTTADEEKRAGGGGVGRLAAGGSKNGAASLSGAGGEGEKSPSVVPGSEDGGDTGQIRVLPRPARHTLEVVQRDSRFIEDVS
ncbi:hypothetical protein BC827DRAFT_1268673 [Russula dissimulans]|nr:hypothetical protein BC827DRAFT_1268673 [Russula dissimulans]